MKKMNDTIQTCSEDMPTGLDQALENFDTWLMKEEKSQKIIEAVEAL